MTLTLVRRLASMRFDVEAVDVAASNHLDSRLPIAQLEQERTIHYEYAACRRYEASLRAACHPRIVGGRMRAIAGPAPRPSGKCLEPPTPV